MNDDLDVLNRLQASLPWTDNFVPEFKARLDEGGFAVYDHNTKHIILKVADIMQVMHHTEHYGFEDTDKNKELVGNSLAQIILAALKMEKNTQAGAWA